MTQFKRILVVIPAQIGDVLLCTPLIRAARERWPGAQIDVLGYAGSLQLLAGNPDISQRIEVSRAQGWGRQIRQALRLWRRYDLAFVARPNDRAHVYGFLAARLRSGLLSGGVRGRRWKQRMTQHGFELQKNLHQVVEKLQLIQPWSPMPDAVSLVPPAGQALPAEIEQHLMHPRVVIHVPSMWRYKQWPVAHYREVVAALLADGVQVVLTGAPSENDQSLIAPVRELGQAPQLLDVSGRVSLPQVCTLLEGADAYFGPDTSVTHLAAAVGVPIVSVYGPTRPQVFGPWPSGHSASQPWAPRAQRQQVGNIVMLQGPDLPDRQCVPCGRMGCEDHRASASHCLVHLPPERVIAELRTLLRPAAGPAPGA